LLLMLPQDDDQVAADTLDLVLNPGGAPAPTPTIAITAARR